MDKLDVTDAQIQSQYVISVILDREDDVQVNVTFSQVYFGELLVSVQVGVSNWQEELHQSQFVVLLSSHCSVPSIILLPQTAHVAHNIVTELVHIQVFIIVHVILLVTIMVPVYDQEFVYECIVV